MSTQMVWVCLALMLLLLCFSIREVAQSHHSLEQELAHAVNASSKAMDVVYANSKGSGVNKAVTSHSDWT